MFVFRRQRETKGLHPHSMVCRGLCREAVLYGPLVFLHVLPAEACLSFILGYLFQDACTAGILGTQTVLLWNKELCNSPL